MALAVPISITNSLDELETLPPSTQNCPVPRPPVPSRLVLVVLSSGDYPIHFKGFCGLTTARHWHGIGFAKRRYVIRR